MQAIQYQRILLKLSGEALMGNQQAMFDKSTVEAIIIQIKELIELKVKLGIVIGGGNIFRGINGKEFGLQKANADYMGMLATIMNGIAFKNFLANQGIKAKIYSALAISNVIKEYNRDSMLYCLEQGNVIIFVGGTGNPFFTTDSGAALRAIEMDANLLIKATKVDGVYTMDPKLYPQAKKYTKLSFTEAIANDLQIMDLAAFDLCKRNNIAIQVCNVFNPNSLKEAVLGTSSGTLIHT